MDFFSAYPRIAVPKHSVLLQPGERPTKSFLILSGSVRLFDVSANGNEVTLNVFRTPAFFSVSWLFSDEPNRFTYQALEACELHVAPIDDVRAFLRTDPSAAYEVLSRIGRGLDGMYLRLAAHIAHDARRRVIVELLIEARRFGITADNGVIVQISTIALANRAGIARETVSRELKQLISEGFLNRHGRGEYIVDVQKLSASIENT